MALVKCYECCRQVSDIASQCPQCGAPKPGHVRTSIACYNCKRNCVDDKLPHCPLCGVPAPAWKCTFCSGKGRSNNANCGVCKGSGKLVSWVNKHGGPMVSG